MRRLFALVLALCLIPQVVRADTTGQLVIVVPQASGTDDQTAAEVPIADVGGFFTGGDAEAAFQQIGPTMTDARSPTSHAASHGVAGGDAVTITEAQISDLLHTVDTDTTCLDAGVDCLFAGSATEGGPATSALSVAADSVALATDTTGNYVASITSGAGITGGDGGSEGAELTIAVTLGTEIEVSELADGIPGQLITWDAAGVPATVATGGSGEVLTSNGAGAAPTFQAAAGGSSAFADLASGTNTTAAMVVGSGSSLKVASTGTIDASGIDADGDGVREISISSSVDLDPNDNGDQDFQFFGGGATNDQIHFFVTGTAGIIKAKSGLGVGLLLSAESGSVLQEAGGTTAASCSSSLCATNVRRADSPSVATCANSGDGSPGFLVITPTTSTVRPTNSDANGCTASLSEVGAVNGQQLRITLVSNAGGTLDFADSAGVQETGAGCSLGIFGVANFEYITDRWVLTGCVATN